MFEGVWIYNTWYTYEALTADDAAWSAAKLAHGLCDKIPPKLAPTREEEEERRRAFARRMAEALYVAGLHAGGLHSGAQV